MPTYDSLQRAEPGAVRQARAVPRVAEVRAVALIGVSSGTLPETQVRAMFDRIARVYDRMNSVMTAGLHQRWRERAADLAAVGPRARALDVATGTGDLAIELRGRGAEVIGLGLLRGDARARAREGARDRLASRATRWRCPSPTTRSTPPRSASARATSPTSAAAWRRWRAWCARAAAWWCWRSPRPSARRCRGSSALWFDRVVPQLGRVAGDPDAYDYLPSSVRRFPGPEGLAAQMAAAGLRDVRWILTAGGIIALHHGTVAVSTPRRAGAGARGGRRRAVAPHAPHREPAGRGGRRATART